MLFNLWEVWFYFIVADIFFSLLHFNKKCVLYVFLIKIQIQTQKWISDTFWRIVFAVQAIYYS